MTNPYPQRQPPSSVTSRIVGEGLKRLRWVFSFPHLSRSLFGLWWRSDSNAAARRFGEADFLNALTAACL